MAESLGGTVPVGLQWSAVEVNRGLTFPRGFGLRMAQGLKCGRPGSL